MAGAEPQYTPPDSLEPPAGELETTTPSRQHRFARLRPWQIGGLVAAALILVALCVVVGVLGARAARVSRNRRLGDAAFPVDMVMTYVDPHDAGWRQRARALHQELKQRMGPLGRLYHEPAREPDPLDPALEGDRDEGYYAVHTATLFMPWLRHVWILTQRPHTPRWLPRDGVVNGVPVSVVHHDEVFDSTLHALPTFNSYMIEAHMHRIPGLAEHFIYFNDDFFVARPLRRSALFADDGTPVLALDDTVARVFTMPSIWGEALRTMQSQCQALRLGWCRTPRHVAAPMKKSVLARVVRALTPALKALKPFRSPADFPVWYIALNATRSEPLPSSITMQYFDSGPEMAAFKGELAHLCCINHKFGPGAKARLDALMARYRAARATT